MPWLSEAREWWSESQKGLSPVKLAITIGTLGVPGFIRKITDETLSVVSAFAATLPLTAAVAIIVYRIYRNQRISPQLIVGILLGTAVATALLSLWVDGIGGGSAIREEFFHVEYVPGQPIKENGTSWLEMLVKLPPLYWRLWGLSGLLSAAAGGWFLGWFWATRVVGYVSKRIETNRKASDESNSAHEEPDAVS